jgi:hypothetical protein
MSNSHYQESTPLVILVPTELNPRSHGHACILALAKHLLMAEQNIYLLPYKPFIFFRHYFANLHPTYRTLPFIADIREVSRPNVLVPESTPPILIQDIRNHSERFIWWLLAPAGLLDSFRPDIRKGDYVAAFSEFVLPDQRDYLFVNPPIDPAIKESSQRYTPVAPRKLQIGFYTGKGRLLQIPPSLHRTLLKYQVVPITRNFPPTRNALVKLLEESNGLITCDPLTNLSLEAALIGTPTYLLGNPFPQSSYERFPAKLLDFVTDSALVFEQRLSNHGPVRKISAQSLFHKSSQASALIAELTSGKRSQDFIVTDQTLEQIRTHLNALIQSETIQAIRGGQSMSSLFLGPYLLSLKLPYRYHSILCQTLAIFDRISEFIYNIGLFRVLLVLTKILVPPYKQLKRMTRSIYSFMK